MLMAGFSKSHDIRIDQINGQNLTILNIRNFINRDESQTLVELIEGNLGPSRILKNTGPEESEFRTSKTCHIGDMNNLLVNELDLRICRFLGINPRYAEKLQAQVYEVGDKFSPHTDYFDIRQNGSEWLEFGQRTYTCMIVVQSSITGGFTNFDQAKVSIKPVSGQMTIWNNLDDVGATNPFSRHEGEPVLSGRKIILTKWFRTRNDIGWHHKDRGEFLPAIDARGFKVIDLNEDIYNRILREHSDRKDFYNPERTSSKIISGPKSEANGFSSYASIDDVFKLKLKEYFQAVVESWTNLETIPSFVYGFRRYLDGAKLAMHRDRFDTHHIGIIIHVDSKLRQPWPLVIEDHAYRTESIHLQPGQALIYESAKLLHGRPNRMHGDYHDNIYLHFTIKENKGFRYS